MGNPVFELFLALTCVLLSSPSSALVNPETEQNELDSLRAKSPVVLSIRVDTVDLSGGKPAVQIEVGATVVSVVRSPEGLAAGDSIVIRYAADYQGHSRLWAKLKEKAREGWAGPSPHAVPALLLPGDFVSAYLSPAGNPTVFHRYAEAEWVQRSERAVVELGKPFRMADHDAAFVTHESGNLVVLTTGWGTPPCPEGYLCRAPVQLGVDVLDGEGRLYEASLGKGDTVSVPGIALDIKLLKASAPGFVDLVFSSVQRAEQEE